MMQMRKLYSLLLVSFIVVFASSMALANGVTFETKNLSRCYNGVENISAVVTADSVSAIEIVFEYNGDITPGVPIFTWDPAFTKLAFRVIDDTTGVDGVMPDTVRVAAILLNPSEGALAAGTYVVGRINFKTKDVCSGSATFGGAVLPYPITATVQTQFVDAATSTLLPVTVTPGTITIANVAPTIANVTGGTIFYGQTFTATAVGADLDTPQGCETLTYGKVSGPGTINATTGAYSWTPTNSDIGTSPTVILKVTDKCGAVAQTAAFTICVQNKPPAFTGEPYPGHHILLGETASGAVAASDPDGLAGPLALVYSVLSFNGPGSFVLNPATGAYSYATPISDETYLGTWTAKILVTDGAPLIACSPQNADTATVTITIDFGAITIQKTHGTIQGQFVFDSVNLVTNYPIGGFDLLISYDASALSLSEVIKGSIFKDTCNWEYFTYRFGPDGNCSGACPSGMVRVVGIAETNNGANHPKCQSTMGMNLFTLKFLVANDRTLNCSYVPVKFFWIDCGDNALSSVTGDTLLLSNRVYHYGGSPDVYYDVTKPNGTFPTEFGATAECLVRGGVDKPWPRRFVDFYAGGVDIACSDSIDARGDVNMNGIGYEIADAVLFSRYFVYGDQVWTPLYRNGQIAATDVNADGLVLTVADLVYLIRVVVGDALPYAKVEVTSSNGLYTYENGRLSVDNGLELGAAYVVVKGEVKPELLVSNSDVTMSYNYDGANTRILVYPNVGNISTVAGFTGEFLAFNGEVLSVEMATPMGMPVVGKLVPKHYALSQNYPNPFNPTTTIEFALPNAGAYNLSIYNISGQLVKTFEGTSEAGFVKVEWNATNVASGVYFYKLNSGAFSATKKMVLLK